MFLRKPPYFAAIDTPGWAFLQSLIVKRENPAITIENIVTTHKERRAEIRRRLGEFAAIGRHGTDVNLLEEMVFCFFTGGCSARMGLNSLEAIKPILLAEEPSGRHYQRAF